MKSKDLKNSLEVIFEDRKAKKYISDIKFSANGKYLGIGSQDGKLFIHDITISYISCKVYYAKSDCNLV